MMSLLMARRAANCVAFHTGERGHCAYHERTMNAAAQLSRAVHRPPVGGRAFWWAG
jgi:hypothetical protein